MIVGSGEPLEYVSYPCSFAQERLLRAEELRPGDPSAHVSLRWKIGGELKQSTLENAWSFLIARHEMLRTRYETKGGAYRQIVEPSVAFHIAVVDCSVLEKSAVDAEVARIATADSRRFFDLAKAPLLRLTRVIVNSNTSILLISAHQIICDGWSFGILSREMGEACDAIQNGRRPSMPELTSTFGTFTRWQRGALTGETLAEELALLQSDFKDATPFEMHVDRPRSARWSSNVETASRLLDGIVAAEFVNRARTQGATPFMAMLAATVIVLGERSREPNVTLTTQVACRDEVDIESVFGPFVNTIPLRIDGAKGRSFDDLLSHVSDVVANAIELRHVPFDCIDETLFGPIRLGHGAHCDVNFVYQKAFTEDAAYGSFTIESEHSRPGGSSCDINLYVVERPKSWRVSCDYNPDLFDRASIESLLDGFERVVAQGVDTREPVLFFHSDLFANGYYAEEIAATIPEFNIIPVDPHGVEGLPMFPTIDAMADDYMTRLLDVQPHGPYRLVGFCSGGQVAFEVARRLEERSEIVEQVVLINASAPVRPIAPFRDWLIRRIANDSNVAMGLRESICYNIARLNRAMVKGPISTAKYVARTLPALLRRRTFVSQLAPGESYLRRTGDERSELSIGHIAAVLSHRPHAYAGDVTLIWSVDQTSLTGEETQGWNALARRVDVVSMNGGHVAPLHSLVGELSEILRATLKATLKTTRAVGA